MRSIFNIRLPPNLPLLPSLRLVTLLVSSHSLLLLVLGFWTLERLIICLVINNFSHFVTSSLPFITLANGFKTVAKGIALAQPLSSLPLHSILYVLECPSNLIFISKLTRSLNFSITFVDNTATLQDQGMGWTIGTGHELHGIYHLTFPPSL